MAGRRQSNDASTNVQTVLAETFAVNERMNQFILEHLNPIAWRVKPPGGKSRTIAAIFAHVHNSRRKWIRLSAPYLNMPAQLDRTRCTQEQASAALEESAARCLEMIAQFGPHACVQQFLRDGWGKPWPAGAAAIAYMLTHEAHHRGQVCMLAHQLGFPIKKAYEIWHWEKLWKQCGFTHPR